MHCDVMQIVNAGSIAYVAFVGAALISGAITGVVIVSLVAFREIRRTKFTKL